MCVVVAKHFNDIGWVLAKNRDQDYVSDITFADEKNPNVKEIFTLYDRNTGYREGMNYKGLTIITASLVPNLTDETDKSDGNLIHDALKMSDPEKAAEFLVKKKLVGFIFIANRDKLVLIEAAKDNHGEGEYHHITRVVPHSELVVRTNHGVDLPWAGFQKGIKEKEDMWRASSESRKRLTEKAVKSATTPQQILDALAAKHNSNLQMNPFRVENKPRDMRTIFQWVLVPSHDTVYVRPIHCRMKLKFTKDYINMKIIDNDVITKTYGSKLKNLCKIKVTDDGDTLKFMSESTLTFSEFRYKV
jgi:hypothetical protein